MALTAARNEGYHFWGVEGASHYIALDETHFSNEYVPEPLRDISPEDYDSNNALCKLLLETTGDELDVLLLGRLLNADELDEEDPESMGTVALLARRSDMDGEMVWERLGICVWATRYLEHEKGIWKSRECTLC
ncbi:hypothetical protein BU26DRAFT_601006 [Trematosphaeria pertusa]|uniref:Uncharacterized protein n=1 Tax=Trematosphaeria pertusa TaxID=390896 RepID=A0A6A6IT26_9PLEO|nr:uncharacterized protein BU26DRAFT_601006 [Trematosphaeria pertusa]KAF2252750.1 hypothetical protein BU26DRAFT_601006 [Trematosphaeria pertusa]